MQISAIWYPVSRWEEANRFYGQVLGLPETARSDEAGWAAYATDGGPPLFLVRQPERAGGSGGAVVTFACDDLDALRERLAAAGARVEAAVQQGAGVRIMTFYDPDGNCLEASEATR